MTSTRVCVVSRRLSVSSAGWRHLVRFVLLFLMTVALIHHARGEKHSVKPNSDGYGS